MKTVPMIDFERDERLAFGQVALAAGVIESLPSVDPLLADAYAVKASPDGPAVSIERDAHLLAALPRVEPLTRDGILERRGAVMRLLDVLREQATERFWTSKLPEGTPPPGDTPSVPERLRPRTMVEVLVSAREAMRDDAERVVYILSEAADLARVEVD